MASCMSRLSVISHIKKTIKSEANFIKQLYDLDQVCSDIEKYYHEYDYSTEKPGNGFRSIVRITDIFFERLHSEEQKCNLSLYPDLLQEYILLAETLSLSLSYAQLLRKKGVTFDTTVQSEVDYEFFSRLFNAPVQSSEPIFGAIGPFYYKGSPGLLYTWLLYLLHLWQLPVPESLRMLCDSKYTTKRMAQSAAAVSLSMVKALIPGPMASKVFRPLVRLSCLMRFASVTALAVPRRTNRWTIRVTDWRKPAVIEKTSIRDGSIRSLLVDSFGAKNESKSIIIHAHGGGFVSNTPDIMAPKSAILSGKIGIPVILPDYRKAPEDKYPAALQDVLDLYVFLTSGDEEVEKMIGFQPEKVYMAGDSAGANLVIAATFVLNHLRKMGESVRMPAAIMTQYPTVCATFVAVPSFSFVLLDSVLARGTLCLVGSMYADIEPAITSEAWHTESEEKTMDIIGKFAYKLKDPLINLLAFRDWGDLRDISLSITACEMDPTLDGSIMLAKAWKGEVVLDIVPGMAHGYTDFTGDPSLAEEIAIYQRQIASAVGVKI